MQLSLTCGHVDDHDDACPRQIDIPKTSTEKAERIQRAVALALSTLSGIEKLQGNLSPSQALLRVIGAETFLQNYPQSGLESFEQKRAYNEAATKLANKRSVLQERFPRGEGERFTADFEFAKTAVEKLFSLSARRVEAAKFDGSALEALPISPMKLPPDRSLKAVCTELEKRLEEGRPMDTEVARWGWKNLRALMLGEDPVDEDSRGAASFLGALVGRGPQTRKMTLKTQFKLLGDRFRERLYLLGANAILLRVVSRLAQAEEAWRKHLSKDGAASWERIKSRGGELLSHILGNQDGLPGRVEDIIAARAGESKVIVLRGLMAFEEIKADEWEAFAMAYFFELAAVVGELSSRDISASGVATILMERRQGVEADRDGLSRTLQHIRETWRARPPRERQG
jgi:hypothetical protein